MPTLPTHASRTAARTALERKLVVLAEVDLDRCTNIYGVTPCTAGRTHTGTAQAGAASTITLAAGASGTDDAYTAMWVRVHTGTGSGQERRITDYVGATKVASVSPSWSVTPDNTSQYHVINRPGACYNTRATCQDKPNFTRGTKTYKFGLRGAAIPPGETVRPYIARADAAVSIIDPEAGLARRNALRLELVDETDSDREQDPYVDDRASAAQGTFWGRLIARNPNMAGRLVRVRRGFVVEPWDWNTFLDELYLIDRVDGPGREGSVAITLKDPVKLTDRTKIPVPTDGKLTAEIKAYAWRGTAAGGSSTTVILGADASSADDAYNGMECYLSAGQGAGQRRTITDYVGETRTATVAAWAVNPSATTTAEVSALSITLTSGKGSQYADPGTSGKREFVRIGEEVIEYTVKSTDTLSWPSAEYRAQFGTSRADHSKDAQVQLCRAFIAQPVTTVVRKLLEEGGLSANYIDTTSLTDAEGEWYGEAFSVTTCLSEPEAPNDLLAELLPQIDAVVWWSPQTQKAVFKVLLPTLGSPGGWGDAGNFIEASVDVETLEELRLTYAAIYYGRGSGTANRREAKQYTLGEIFVDTDAEAAAEYGDRRSEVVYSRWFGAGNQIAMRAWVGRRLAARRDAPRRIRARLDPKDYDIPAGEFKDITTRRLVDAAGAPKATRCLVTKVEDRGTHIEVEARTTGFAKRYGFIAPNGTADHPTDTTYAHISQNTGLMSDGSEGYLII